MSSPFPGMDPFIESRRIWSDFHLDLAAEIRAHLNAHIQPGYYATAVTYVTYEVIEVTQSTSRAVSPDVSVWRTELRLTAPGTAAVIDPPLARSTVPLEVPVRVTNVEVRESSTDMLVTAIEILSPTNKRPGRERQKYLRKRCALLRSQVHVMELDLLRGGERTPLETAVPLAPYYVTLARLDHRPHVDVWPIQLAMQLPVLPVPLSAPDPDVALDLGMIVQAVYERGGYTTRIDYGQPVPPPPLDSAQQVWVTHLLARYSQ
jgi:hypothetical protein